LIGLTFEPSKEIIKVLTAPCSSRSSFIYRKLKFSCAYEKQKKNVKNDSEEDIHAGINYINLNMYHVRCGSFGKLPKGGL